MASRIIELGNNFISKIGTKESVGTKIISVSGDVAKPGIYEIEWGMKKLDGGGGGLECEESKRQSKHKCGRKEEHCNGQQICST